MTLNQNVFSVIFIFFISVNLAISQNFKLDFQDAIFSIESPDVITDTLTNSDTLINKPIGTAFLLGMSSYFKNKIFLVTARHNLKYVINNLNSEMILRIPINDPILKSVRINCDLKRLNKNNILFPKDTCYDIAAIELSELKSKPLEKISTDNKYLFLGSFGISMIKNSSDTLREGQPIIFAGYPKGLSGKYRNYLIYRFGIISALILDKYEELCSGHILINSESIGGDSGSPVCTYPMSIYDNSSPKIIGVLSGSYFTGLSVVEPIEIIMSMIDEYLSKIE